MLCALTAARRGLDVTLLEPNRLLGRKLRITGKGRCNVTNNCDIRDFMQSLPSGGRFLYPAVGRFTPQDVMSFFEELGVPLKTERGGRVFPVSDNANDIAGALTDAIHRAGVRVIHRSAKRIVCKDETVNGVLTDAGETLPCRAAVICTGGLSYPLTGSTGGGYALARELGHSITPCRPSLVPLESGDGYCAAMQGFAPKNVVLSAYEDDKLIYRELGEMLFTHFGVSGPLVLSASAHMRSFGKCLYRLSIDLKPALDEKKLDARLLRDFEKYRNRDFENALCDLAGRAMIPVLVELSGIPASEKVNSITREQRHRLLKLFKNFPVSITGPRPIAEAIVTAGGVSTREINPHSMESKLVSGLFFAGEVIDLDAYTGGFNLQIAWSTAALAANSI